MLLKNTYYLVRHGESEFNVTDRNDSGGNPDNHLTQKGIREIEACAEKLKNDGVVFDKIISSPLPRTRESAEIFSHALNMDVSEITFAPLLWEMNHGSEAQDKPIQRNYEKKSAYEALHVHYGDGECYWDVRERMIQLITGLEREYVNNTLLLVTHGTPVWMFYSAVHGLNEEETMQYRHQRKIEKGFFIKNADPVIINPATLPVK